MKKLALGVDIGGTNTVFGLVDEIGNVLFHSHVPTEDYPYQDQYEAYVEALCAEINKLAGHAKKEGYELAGIGIGAPNANYHKGTVEHPANLWKFRKRVKNPDESLRLFQLGADVSKGCGGVNVRVTNDANAATLGEMLYGEARGLEDFMMITLGTGLGSGFVANGKMIYGHDGFAGEAGHIVVDRNGGRVCGCGRVGCLETYASATGLVRTTIELLARMREKSKLRRMSPKKLTSKKVAELAAEGDVIAQEAFRFTGEILGRALADMVTITSPQTIILFGGLAKSGDLILAPTRKYMEENMLFVFKNKVKLILSSDKDGNAAVRGAAALIWQNEVK